jgi:hypothetical protein
LTAWAAVLPVAWIGVRNWQRDRFGVAIAYLLALCLLAPIAMLVTLEETGLFAAWAAEWNKLWCRLRFDVRPQRAIVVGDSLGLPVCWWLRATRARCSPGVRRDGRHVVYNNVTSYGHAGLVG